MFFNPHPRWLKSIALWLVAVLTLAGGHLTPAGERGGEQRDLSTLQGARLVNAPGGVLIKTAGTKLALSLSLLADGAEEIALPRVAQIWYRLHQTQVLCSGRVDRDGFRPRGPPVRG